METFRPTLRALAALLAGALIVLGAAPAALATDSVEVSVLDTTDSMSEADQDLLRGSTPDIDFPAEVSRVEYLLLDQTHDNLNDTVHGLGETERTDLLNDDRTRFAEGVLILAIGLDPNELGAYAGDDVAAALGIDRRERLDGILDAMTDPARDDRYAAALLEGARAAADTSVVSDGSSGDVSGGVVAAVIGGVAALVAAIGGALALSARKKKARTAREQYGEVQRSYADVAHSLDEIDVRANNLTSPLADDRLRSDWDDVHTRFLTIDGVLAGIPDLSESSPDKDYRAHADAIGAAHKDMTEMRAARDNIEELWQMEHGDASVRRRQLTDLVDDAAQARLACDKESLVAELRDLEARMVELRGEVDAPDFMDRYADLVAGLQRVLTAVADADLDGVEQSVDRTPPRIYDSGWRPGYGYHGFAPWVIVSSWNSADRSAAQAASSSSTNTSFSSGGFSGAGGSRGF